MENDVTKRTPKNRADEVISALVEAIKNVIREKDVSYEEYRSALGVLNKYNGTAPYEINLVCDMFFEQAVHDQAKTHLEGSRPILKGPYFLEGAPEVTDSLKTVPGEGEPFMIRAHFEDPNGAPIEGVRVNVWHANPEGNYSGYFDDFPIEYFRGKVLTDSQGNIALKTTKPKEYPIPTKGPTGEILKAMERSEWRPAHIHFLCEKEGFRPHITQAYFADHAFVDDDVVDGVRPDVVYEIKQEGEFQAIDVNVVMNRAPVKAAIS